MFRTNCCDGIYKSFDIHFTSICDNKCSHCIDNKYEGLCINKPNVEAIVKTIVDNQTGYEDVLFLGGEPCLHLKSLYECIKQLKERTSLKLYITTSVPKCCYDQFDLFYKIIEMVDGINLSVQHYDENVADEIRKTKSHYDRQSFYKHFPFKSKTRINLNIVKPFLYKKEDILTCLKHYDDMGFAEIKLSEIQHGKEYYVSFENIMGIKLKSPYSHGCQTFIDMKPFIPGFKGKLLLKRSCFLCEESLKASFIDGVKSIYRLLTPKPEIKYGVIYENGDLTKGWI